MGKTIDNVNICNIVFDEKFKLFINTMKNVFIDKLELSKECRNNIYLADAQEIYRNYIISKKSDLTLTQNKIINQEFFAILVCLILPNIDDITKFEDVFKNYKKDFIIFDNNLHNCDNTIDRTDTHCACCHLVKGDNVYRFINITTGFTLLIGCDCIKKYKILSDEELKELKDKRQLKNRLKPNHCFFCGKNTKCKACKNNKLINNIFIQWKKCQEYQKGILYFYHIKLKGFNKNVYIDC